MNRKNLCFQAALCISIIFTTVSFAQSPPIFGPKTYTREKGKPEKTKETFQVCALSGIYKLIVENGYYTEEDKGETDEDKDKKEEEKKEKKTRVSAGEIEINGKEIVEEDDFNKKATRVEKTITLPEGETLMEVEVEGKPGAYITVTIECISGCLEVNISSPASGSAINKSKTIINGSLYNAFGETGVALQWSGAGGQWSGIAETQDTNFAGIAPLQQGQNTITVTATDACGYQAHDTITINTDSIQERIRLTANPQSGIPDATGTFSTTIEADASPPNPISSYSWDTNGDGTAEQTGKDLSKITATYQAPDLYFPKVTITDNQNNTYTETTIVNVLSKEQMDTLLKGKWEGMKGALASGKIDGALKYFSENSRDSFRGQFSELADFLPQIAGELGSVTWIDVTENLAEYDLRISIDGITYTFQLSFVRDSDGIWRIRTF